MVPAYAGVQADGGHLAMCRPIRAITEAKGVSLPKHILSCFGGAGGQHSCGSELEHAPSQRARGS